MVWYCLGRVLDPISSSTANPLLICVYFHHMVMTHVVIHHVVRHGFGLPSSCLDIHKTTMSIRHNSLVRVLTHHDDNHF